MQRLQSAGEATANAVQAQILREELEAADASNKELNARLSAFMRQQAARTVLMRKQAARTVPATVPVAGPHKALKSVQQLAASNKELSEKLRAKAPGSGSSN